MKDINIEDEALKEIIERLPDEPAGAYRAFLLFLRLPFEQQSGARYIEPLMNITSYTRLTLQNFKALYGWEKRLEMVEAYRFMQELRERQELTKNDRINIIEQNRSVKKDANEISLKMIKMSQKMLDMALQADDIKESGFVRTEDGRTIPTTTVIRTKWNIRDIPIVAKTAILIQRMVNDLPTEIVENNVTTGADLENLSFEELDAMEEETNRKLKNLTGIQKANESIN